MAPPDAFFHPDYDRRPWNLTGLLTPAWPGRSRAYLSIYRRWGLSPRPEDRASIPHCATPLASRRCTTFGGIMATKAFVRQYIMDILDVAGGKPVKLWTEGVPVEDDARKQLMNTARMPFIFKHLAVMPDVHLGKGSTIGSVIPTVGAIIPAAVGWTSVAA